MNDNNTDLLLADKLEDLANRAYSRIDWEEPLTAIRHLADAILLISAEIRKAGEEG